MARSRSQTRLSGGPSRGTETAAEDFVAWDNGSHAVTSEKVNATVYTALRRISLDSPLGMVVGRPWNSDEDAKLINAVQMYGDDTEKWKTIAAYVPGRTNKACRKVA